MDRETVCKLIMGIEHPDAVAAIFSALDTENRVRTFEMLYEGKSPKQITGDGGVLPISRSAIQPYLTDFKETGLVEIEGKEYHVTERGETVYELVQQVDTLYNDLTELQEFLIENPEVVPDAVLDEIERRRENEGDGT